MKITFLGTSSGKPTKTRNVSSLVFSLPNSKEWFLIDCGEGTQHRLLKTKFSLMHLAAIFITHIHGDHCYGLPGLLASISLAGRKNPLKIIGPSSVQSFVKVVMDITEQHLNYKISFVNVENSNNVFEGNGIKVSCIQLSHRVPSYAYKFVESNVERRLEVEKLRQYRIPPGPIWGKLKRGEIVTLSSSDVLDGEKFLGPEKSPRSIVFAGDNDKPDILTDACTTASLLVHEATFTEELRTKLGVKHQHSSAFQLGKFAESISIPNLILSHFSPRFKNGRNGSLSPKDIENEVRSEYSGNLFLANDFDNFHLTRTSELRLENY